jgi:hypothetical protein
MNKPVKPPPVRTKKTNDPKSINSRLYNQVAVLLDQLEAPVIDGPKITLKERITALIAIGRLQVMFVGLRKEKADEPERGSSVRKYAEAFAANDARRGKDRGGPAPAADEPDLNHGFGGGGEADDGDDDTLDLGDEGED